MKQLLKEGNKKINTMNNKKPGTDWSSMVSSSSLNYETVGS